MADKFLNIVISNLIKCLLGAYRKFVSGLRYMNKISITLAILMITMLNLFIFILKY